MNPLEWILKGRFGTAARAGVGFVTVSIVGAIGLVVIAIVLWAASLTPFGLWAGVPVIAAGALVAWSIWRQGQAEGDASAALEFRAPSFWSGSTAGDAKTGLVELPRSPRVKLIGLPASLVPQQLRRVSDEPRIQDADDLKRMFDQAFAVGHFDEAERVLTELAMMPGQTEWTRRKQRLVRQQRARS